MSWRQAPAADPHHPLNPRQAALGVWQVRGPRPQDLRSAAWSFDHDQQHGELGFCPNSHGIFCCVDFSVPTPSPPSDAHIQALLPFCHRTV